MVSEKLPEIPDFKILGRIGGGSYGEVFLARSVTGVLRAVKIVRRQDFERDKTFEREFEGIKRYEEVSRGHDGLVDVFYVGRNDESGFYYYVMELADDCETGDAEFDIDSYKAKTLGFELKRQRQHDIGECIRIGRKLAEALAHLHHAGLTHRDVKPSNIIFVNGEPRLADVGLVARTGQRTFVGTEGYVPPEGPGTSSADLYSLAMVLYEMATGKDRLDFPELPTNLELPPTMNRDEWRALNSAICRAGSPDPRKRYETGRAFSKALGEVRQVEKPQNKGLLRLAAGIVLLLAILGLGGAFAMSRFQAVATVDPPPSVPGEKIEDPGVNPDIPIGGPTAPPVSEAASEVASATTELNTEPFIPNVFNPATMLLPNNGFNADLTNDVVISDSESTLKPIPDIKTDPIKEPTPPPPAPKAKFKIYSAPDQATIWIDDKEIGRTPTSYLSFEPGTVKLTLKKQGFHDLSITKKLTAGKQQQEFVLIPDRRPKPGEDWRNGLDIDFKFEPALSIFISKEPISPQAFAFFNESTGRPDAVASQAGAAYVPNDEAMFAFCDWLTEEDRKKGFLGDNQYFVPQRSGTDGESATFHCRIDDRFGSIQINSKPDGANIFKNGKIIGTTPKMLTHERVGEVRYEIGRPGFQRAEVIGEIAPNKLNEVEVSLKRDNSVVFGKPWTNSIGQRFVPVGDLMASIWETRVQDFALFLETQPEGIPKPSPGYKQEPNHPIAGVSADDARAFCAWLTEKERSEERIQLNQEYRLPTDVEWSLMAGLEKENGTTPDQRDSDVPDLYPWGKEWPPPENAGNFADESARSSLGKYTIKGYEDGFPKTSPVGIYEPRENGIFDLAGNLWEWVEEPPHPDSKRLTARGGGWNVSERDLFLVSYRNAVSPNYARDNIYGFRCVLAEVK